jgi:hypothetical protein
MATLAWRHLPLILLFDVIFCAALVPAAIAQLAGAGLLVPVIASLTAGPAWFAGAAVLDRIARGDEEVGAIALAKALARSAAGAVIALPYGLVGTLALAALATRSGPGGSGSAAALLLDISAATLLLLALPAVFTLAARGLKGRSLWWGALAIATLRPAVFAELALGAGIVAAIAVMSHGPGLLFFAPGFVALHCAVSVNAAGRLDRRNSQMRGIDTQ